MSDVEGRGRQPPRQAPRGRYGARLAAAAGVVVVAVVLLWLTAQSVSDARTERATSWPAPDHTGSTRPQEASREPVADLSGTPPPVVVAALPGVPRVGRSQVVTDGSRRGKMVALTFDDNYAPESAVPILDSLARAEAPATVFLVGGATRTYAEVAERIARNPLLEVGDHSGSHPDLTRLDGSALEEEIGAGVTAYREMTGGHTSRLFRAPGGHVDGEVLRVAAAEGFAHTIAFDPGPADYEGVPASTIVEDVRREVARAGGIVLLHFNAAHTAEAIPDLVFSLRARGYRLVTVSELLRGDRLWFDVDPDDAAYPAILALARARLMEGYPTGDYGAHEPMSRVDLACVLARCFDPGGVSDSGAAGPSEFSDVRVGPRGLLGGPNGLSDEEVSAVTAMKRLGLMQGGRDDEGRTVFRPLASVRRVDLALAVARAAEGRLPASAGDVVDRRLEPDLPADVQAVMMAVVAAGFMDAPGGALAPWEPVGRAGAAVTVHRLVQVVAPELLGQHGAPAWWAPTGDGS